MRLNPKRILQEDFKDQPWIGRLLTPINEIFSQLNSIINGGLTIKDNLRAEIKELEIRDTDIPLKFRCKYPEKPKSIVVGFVEEIAGSPAVITNPVWVHWSWDQEVVTVLSVTGITPGTKYRINLNVSYN